MRVQKPEKQTADARRKQLVAAQTEIEIVEELGEEKLAEN